MDGPEDAVPIDDSPANQQQQQQQQQQRGSAGSGPQGESGSSTKLKEVNGDAEAPPTTSPSVGVGKEQITLMQTVVLVFVPLIPTAIVVVAFTLMGFGLDLYNAMARAKTDNAGWGGLAFTAFWFCVLFICDAHRASIFMKVTVGVISAALVLGTAILKAVSYPWGAPLLVLLFIPAALLRLRTSRFYRSVCRRQFYHVAGMSTLATASILGCAWLLFTCFTNYTDDGALWTPLVKAKLILDTEDVYDNVYADRALDYAVDCGPGKTTISDESEQNRVDEACAMAETVWFVVWMVPFGALLFNFFLAFFCGLETRFKLADGRGVVRLLQQFVCVLVFLIAGMYVSIYASGVSVYLASAFMALAAATILMLMVYVNYEVEPAVLKQAAAESSFAQNMAKAFKSDWVRAVGVGSANVLIPFMLALDMMRQQVRRLTKRTVTEGRYTEFGRSFIDNVSTWNWNSILTKVIILGEIFGVLILGSKFTYIFFSWLNEQLADFALGVVFVLVFIVGCLMFMLPMVPGSAVYLFAGIVIGKQAQASIGFWWGVVLASLLGLLSKLVACCGQYGIGFMLGKSVKVQKMIGVDTVPTRAIEYVLNQRGMQPGKVAILVGGPDWPTSVTCGILKLNIPQMILGTLPVFIASIAPQTLVGALLTKESDGNDTLWSAITTACTGVAAVCQAGACLVATRTILRTVEERSEELSQPRPEHAKVAELTAAESDLRAAFAQVEAWPALSSRRRATVLLGAALQLLAGFLLAADFVLVDPICFRKFAVSDSIDIQLDGKVINVFLVPVGVAAVCIWVLGCCLHTFHSKDIGRLARQSLQNQ